jgi:hypothetical protein
MPEPISNHESSLWDAMYGDVKFLLLQYKLRDEWTSKESAEQAIILLLQYHGKAPAEYWKFIRALRIMSLFEGLLKTPLPEDVQKLVKRTDKAIFRKQYSPYLAKFWNREFLTKRQQARKGTNSPYKSWSWLATRAALKELAADRPNTFRHVLAYYEAQYEAMRPMKPPSLTRLLRYMRDIAFELEAA